MQYQSAAEKTSMMLSLAVEDLKKIPKIQSAKRKLLIVLSILLVLTIIHLFQKLASGDPYNSESYGSVKTDSTSDIIAGVIMMIYSIIFIIVATKYIRFGILIFAWLTVILTVGNLIISFLGISKEVSLALASNNYGIVPIVIVISIIGVVIGNTLLILTIVFSFKLTKLIKISETIQTV